MSDEIKKDEQVPEVITESSEPLPESELEKVAGGVHPVDKASPVLMQHCADGTHIKQ